MKGGFKVKNLTLTVLLFFQTGCGIFGPGELLEPGQLCSDHSDDAIPTFEDAALAEATSLALEQSRPPSGLFETRDRLDLTCGRISGLTSIDAVFSSEDRFDRIASLVGIQNLTSLEFLFLWDNSITDITALSGLTSLTQLTLASNSISDISALSGLTSLRVLLLNHNSITDIGPLSGLTSLRQLELASNSITDISALSGLTSLEYLILDNNPNLTDIQPLLDNTGLGTGDDVDLRSTNVSCTDVAALEAKGVPVDSDCP